jgi:hypothetical protein
MRVEHDGITLWFGTSDAPAPSGAIAPDSSISFCVGVHPADAANRVKISYRTQGQPNEEAVQLRWWRNDVSDKTQYFRTRLPASRFRAGETVEYTAICRCIGRQVPSPGEAERLVASFHVVDEMASEFTAERTYPKESLAVSVSNLAAEEPLYKSPTIVDAPPEISESLSVSPASPRAIHLSFQDKNGAEISPGGVIANPPGAPQAQDVRTTTPEPSLRLEELCIKLGRAPSLMLSELSKLGIHTLEDVRRVGGVGRLAGARDVTTAELIDAHADLARFSLDVAANVAIIAAGYTSTWAIAEAPLSAFLTAARPIFGEAAATRLHVDSFAQVRALDPFRRRRPCPGVW